MLQYVNTLSGSPITVTPTAGGGKTITIRSPFGGVKTVAYDAAGNATVISDTTKRDTGFFSKAAGIVAPVLKVIAKVAPIAAVAAIPGALPVARAAASGAVDVIKAVAPVILPVLSPPVMSPPASLSPPPVPSNAGASAFLPAGGGQQTYQPAMVGPVATPGGQDWTMPAIVVGAAVLLAMTMNRKH